MPSQPDPNSPFLASRLQATLGVRSPGTPSEAGTPGVQAGGFNFPAPPAPAVGGIPGRPTTPQAPTPQAPTPAAPTPQAKGTAGAEGKPPAPTGPAPLGVPTDDGGGLALTPEGDMAYRQAVLRGRDALGPIPRIFRHASLPEVPFELGQSNYNPFTGAWGIAAQPSTEPGSAE